MSLARIIATGRGKLNARLEIEGWPAQPVTRAAMEQTLADGRTRVNGLKLEGLKLAARLNLPTGKIDAQGFTVSLVDPTPARKIIAAFRTRPTRRTYLSGYISKSATTIPVFSTDGWPTSGVLHLGTEAISYAGKTATTFTGATRGVWNTQAQAHFVSDASSVSAAFEADNAAMAFPEVTDRPTTIEGRRAFLHLYGDGDSPLGEGTQRWQGVCSTAPRVEGLKVSFSVDPPTAILKQQIGGDVASPVGIRGIYYPWSAPFVMTLSRNVDHKRSSEEVSEVLVRVTGFFETQADFCDELTAELASAISGAGWTGTIVASPTTDGFSLVYTTASADPRWVRVNMIGISALEGAFFGPETDFDAEIDIPISDDRVWTNRATGDLALTVAASTTYEFGFRSTVPRAFYGTDTVWTRADRVLGILDPTEASTWPGDRIYLGGLVALSADMSFALDGDPPTFYRAGSVDVAARSLRVGVGSFRLKAFDQQTRFRIGRVLAFGNVGDLVEALVAQSPDVANAGSMPLVRESDIDVTSSDVALTAVNVAAALDTPAVSDRAFIAFGQDTTLEELIGPELVAAGMHWTISQSGPLAARRPRLAASTEPAAHDLAPDPTRDTGGKLVGAMPVIEEAALWGFISDFVYLTGYDPLEDEHTGPEVRLVNVQARSPARDAKKLEVAQKSVPRARFAYTPTTGVAGEPTQEEIAVIARFWLGLLGGTYDILSCRANAPLFDAMLGDTIAVTSRYVPDDDGTMGITGKLGVLIGFAWDLDTMSGSLELLTHSRPIVGYAPEFRVDSYTATSGLTEWELVLNLAEETDETTIGEWILVGDRVRVVEWDSSTPTEAAGTVTGYVGGDGLLVVLDAPLDLASTGTTLWTVRPLISDEYNQSDNLGRFAFVAESTGRTPFADGTIDAKEFAP
jgi:hypothetical protein